MELGPVEIALMASLTLLLMVGIGSSLTVDAFRAIAERPRAVFIGLLSQYGWMPALATLLLRGLEVEEGDALGLLLMACMAGGNASNMLTYLARADLALSLSMTAASTVLSVVAVPVLLGVYAPLVTGGGGASFGMPIGSIAQTLAVMLLPVPLGMLIRARRPEIADKLNRAGTYAALGLVVAILVQSLDDHVRSLVTAAPALLGACVLLVVGGLGLGWAAARLVGLPAPQRRAVALETGIQNTPMALAVMAAALPAERVAAMSRVPLLYAAIALMVGGLVTLGFRLVARAEDASPRAGDAPPSSWAS